MSPLRHMEHLLLVTSCDSPAGIGASLRTDGRTKDGWTDRRDVGNSILDLHGTVKPRFSNIGRHPEICC